MKSTPYLKLCQLVQPYIRIQQVIRTTTWALGDDDAFADAEFDPSELITGEGEGPELTEAGRVRSDFTNDTRYRPY